MRIWQCENPKTDNQRTPPVTVRGFFRKTYWMFILLALEFFLVSDLPGWFFDVTGISAAANYLVVPLSKQGKVVLICGGFAAVVVLLTAFCWAVASKIRRYRTYPYPGMIVVADTEQLSGDEALKKAKEIQKAGWATLLIGCLFFYWFWQDFGEGLVRLFSSGG